MRAFGIELSPNIRSITGKRKFLTPIKRASIVLAAKFDYSLTAITRTVKRV
ncbi:hypothetical protein BT67DRAFT_441284 [Trichocladium antarcticum]|uniref:Uncharacterized protein n=1 Tax=Trichocladium antarcticum TaxID=1450529 RepID=A0AAN6ZDZ8_9PEZI|nr:hypothetical protein BT67DRAFT_441284 [Trichocladium antarcticum]